MAAQDRNTGFVLLHRSIREHWLWKDAIKLKWWLDIIMECNHEDRKVPLGFQIIDCKRGQSVNSMLTWAERWGINKDSAASFIKMLRKDNMITTENLKITTRITVCNYDSYNNLKHAIQNGGSSKTSSKQKPDSTDPAQTKNELKIEERSIGASAPKPYREMTEKDFYTAIAQFKDQYPKEMLRDFYDYWREPSPTGLMLFQLKKTWALPLRLKRWQTNNVAEKRTKNAPAPASAPLEKVQTL